MHNYTNDSTDTRFIQAVRERLTECEFLRVQATEVPTIIRDSFPHICPEFGMVMGLDQAGLSAWAAGHGLSVTLFDYDTYFDFAMLQ
jgi:hypothetical protein